VCRSVFDNTAAITPASATAACHKVVHPPPRYAEPLPGSADTAAAGPAETFGPFWSRSIVESHACDDNHIPHTTRPAVGPCPWDHVPHTDDATAPVAPLDLYFSSSLPPISGNIFP